MVCIGSFDLHFLHCFTTFASTDPTMTASDKQLGLDELYARAMDSVDPYRMNPEIASSLRESAFAFLPTCGSSADMALKCAISYIYFDHALDSSNLLSPGVF